MECSGLFRFSSLGKDFALMTWIVITLLLACALAASSWLVLHERRHRKGLQDVLVRLLKKGVHHDSEG